MPNPFNKTRPIDHPYEVWRTADDTWEWRVLKKYKAPENEEKDVFARWYVAVKSPFTNGAYEYGDSYAQDIKASAYLAERYEIE